MMKTIDPGADLGEGDVTIEDMPDQDQAQVHHRHQVLLQSPVHPHDQDLDQDLLQGVSIEQKEEDDLVHPDPVHLQVIHLKDKGILLDLFLNFSNILFF